MISQRTQQRPEKNDFVNNRRNQSELSVRGAPPNLFLTQCKRVVARVCQAIRRALPHVRRGTYPSHMSSHQKLLARSRAIES